MTALHPIRILIVAALLALLCAPAEARSLQRLTTPAGIGIWLVEDHGIPIVAVGFAFRGGSVEDPPGKEGAGQLVSAMLDEGAGPYDADAFKDKLEAIGSQLTFSVSRNAFSGGLVTLTKHLDASADLLGLALREPRLSEDDFERAKAREIAALGFENRDPERVAFREFSAAAFAGHPYARPVKGTPGTLAALTLADIRSQRDRLIARSQLHVVMVGAIDAAKASQLADDVFAKLPAGVARTPVPPVALKPMAKVVASPNVQGLETAVFALPMPGLGDPQFFAALTLNHVVGSGNFDARLTRELRVKRGLTYSVATQISADAASSIMLGVFSTQPGKMDEALDALRTTFADLQANGPGTTELENAKSGLNGAYLLDLETSARLADHLLGLWIDGLDADYGEVRKRGVDAVTKADADKAAQALLDPTTLSILVMRPGAAR
ncbi:MULTISPECIES: pitrilysin family protein [Rhodomicrobium]|uniref:M16 family metallopeptidase n=1 Tax=Rhodomicrobium TaxID=1068 RepID=UPI000B4BA52A|nr:MULTISPECIES: pitrilysin family protein [Rhodomicrobium]